MPNYDKKEKFAVYNVISAKDAFALLKEFASNQNFNTEDAEEFFISKGVTVWGLVAPAHRLSDEVNGKSFSSKALKIAKKDRSSGRS
jgi:hypothetical protein